MGNRRALKQSRTILRKGRIRNDRREGMTTVQKVWLSLAVLLFLQLIGWLFVIFVWRQGGSNEASSVPPHDLLSRGGLRRMYASNRLNHLLGAAYTVGGVDDLLKLGYGVRPRLVIYTNHILDEILEPDRPSFQRLPDDYPVYPSKREMNISADDLERRNDIVNNSKHYVRHAKYAVYEEYPECKPMYEWQSKSFPACNNVHEIDMSDFNYERNKYHRQIYYKAHGYFRDVFVIRDINQEKRVLKTLRYWHTFDELNFDRHRKDAVAMERLTASPYVMDIYGFCGQTAIFDFGEEGNIDTALWESDHTMTYMERLKAATQVSQAVTSLHTFFDKAPAIAHTDIMTNQFIYSNGMYKLNDFNRCIFLYWNTTSNSGNCPFKFPDENAWTFRSPEEYIYGFQSEKIDVYSMGNIFFTLLEDDFPFHEVGDDISTETVQTWVKEGRRPDFVTNAHIRNTTHPAVLAVKHAMYMSWKHDWRERASAKEVQDYLIAELARIEQFELDKKWQEEHQETTMQVAAKDQQSDEEKDQSVK